MRNRRNPVNPTVETLRGSIALEATPPNRKDALRECEAVMFDLLQKAERGQPLTITELERFRRAQQRARIVISRE